MYKILHLWGWEIEYACSALEKIEKNMQRLQCTMVEKIRKNVLTLYFFQQRFRLTDSLGKSSAGISDLVSLVIVYLGYVWGYVGGVVGLYCSCVMCMCNWS
jgi:hypothetical protein